MSDPTLSVVVPVYNDPDGVRETLESLTTQDAPAETYELLVVDNDSTDTTPEVIDSFEKRYPELVVGLEETDVQSSYAARNTGIERARGDIIAFIDADMTVAESWVANICDAFTDSDIDYLGYEVEMCLPDGDESFWGRYDVATGLPVKHYMRTKRFAPTCALAVQAAVFEEVGQFDASLESGGDKEFGRRIHAAGFEMGFSDSIVVGHPARTAFRSHLKKARRIGRGQVQLWRHHGLAPHPLSPSRWLPPSPTRVYSRSGTLSVSFMLYYLFGWFLKCVQSTTAVSRWL